MAAGYNLPDGKYDERFITDDEKWSITNDMFSSKSMKTTSYKYAFLKSILDNLDNVDSYLCLTFDQLFSRFTELYCDLILKYNLRQKKIGKDKKRAAIETILEEAVLTYKIPDVTSYEELSDNIKDDISHQVKIKCKENVVGALYEDTNRLLYSFNKKEEWIKINPHMYEFVCKYRSVIEKLNNYEWAIFLEKINDGSEIGNILSKLEESNKGED